jgi:S1-C subfamily serine protease
MGILSESPFPFQKPMAYQLWRVIAGMFPVPLDAIAFAERYEVDRLDLPTNLSPRQLWHVILETTAIKGTTGDMIKEALAQNARSPHAAFLKALLADVPAAVSPEPVAGFDPAVTKPESLLFTDDLTIPAGRVPALIATLQRVGVLAPAVCLLRVENPYGGFFGTGFKIGPDLVLTNHHVLFPEKTQATDVRADFGFDVDAAGASLPVVSLVGSPATIDGDPVDDWAVICVAKMDAAWPTIDLANARVPKAGERAYIVQHAEGQQKRLGFVRNTISAVTDDRVQYLTDTQPGSSGAPVFDEGGQLIALHHRGGTPTTMTGKAPLTKNQGIRISRVYAALKARKRVT